MNSSQKVLRTGVVGLLLLFILIPLRTVCPQEEEPTREVLITAARDMMEAAGTSCLVTLDESGQPRARTMDPFPPDENMVVWFGTNRRTRKVRDIRNDPRVTLYYADPNMAGYVQIYGTARLVDDPGEKARRWKDGWEQYYPDRDATYLLIEVTPNRLEVVDYSRGIVGDPETWKPPFVEFKGEESEDSIRH